MDSSAGDRCCPICGGTARRPIYRQQFHTGSVAALLRGYVVVVCARCGFAFAAGVPSQPAIDRYYARMANYEYAHDGGREPAHVVARYARLVRMVADNMADHDARILDVGCATGTLLAMLRRSGYRSVTGLDPSPRCAERAGAVHGLRVVSGTLSGLDQLDETYDLIILSHVLEHVRDLAATLAAVARRLTPRGHVLVEVPDATRFARCGDGPYQQFSVEHINFFSPISLENLLCRAAFARVACTTATHELGSGAHLPVVTCLARRVAAPRVDLAPDTVTEPRLQAYVDSCAAEDRRIGALIDELVTARTPIMVWGTGTHTMRLLATSTLARADIVRFIDRNARHHGQRLLDRPIIAPEQVLGLPEPILVSSMLAQADIVHEARARLGLPNRLIVLYASD